MLRRVALVGIDVSEELGASIIKVTRIGELGTTLRSYDFSSHDSLYGWRDLWVVYPMYGYTRIIQINFWVNGVNDRLTTVSIHWSVLRYQGSPLWTLL
jgi:hypothetical protein